MALTKCPDCGSSVSSVAPTCPKCGRPIAVPVVAVQGPRATTGDGFRFGCGVFGFLLFLCVGVPVLLVVGCGLLAFIGKTTEARMAARERVRENAAAPSAQTAVEAPPAAEPVAPASVTPAEPPSLLPKEEPAAVLPPIPPPPQWEDFRTAKVGETWEVEGEVTLLRLPIDYGNAEATAAITEAKLTDPFRAEVQEVRVEDVRWVRLKCKPLDANTEHVGWAIAGKVAKARRAPGPAKQTKAP